MRATLCRRPAERGPASVAASRRRDRHARPLPGRVSSPRWINSKSYRLIAVKKGMRGLRSMQLDRGVPDARQLRPAREQVELAALDVELEQVDRLSSELSQKRGKTLRRDDFQ